MPVDPHGLLDTPTQALEAFVAARLVEHGVWPSVRFSDGLTFARVVEHGQDRVRVAGRLIGIDQVPQAFWLEVRRLEGHVAWALYLHPISARAERAGVEADDEVRPERWREVVSGTSD